MENKKKLSEIDKGEVSEKLLLPTNDVIFHCIFGTIGNERITKAFLEKILNRKVDELNLDLNLNLIREYYDSKLGVLDIRVKGTDGTNYNIEMQNSSYDLLPERILSYWSRLYTGDLKKGDNYEALEKTIAILIVNDKITRFNLIEKFHTKWNIREEDYADVILTDYLEIHIIELPKYIQMIGGNSNVKNIWLDFILEPERKEVQEGMATDEELEVLKEAREKWKKVTSDEKIRDMALRWEMAELDKNTMINDARRQGIKQGIEQGMEQGIKQGMEKGINQERKENAKKMLEKGIKIEDISEITGLTKEEIESL